MKKPTHLPLLLPLRSPLRLLLPVVATFFMASPSALSTEVTASLSHSQVNVGEPFQLIITAQGTTAISLPDNFAPEGLRVLGQAQHIQTSIINFRVTMGVNLIVTMVADREGEFVIPPLPLRAGDQIIQTQELRLRVAGGNPPSSPPQGRPPPAQGTALPHQSQAPSPSEGPARLELIVPVTEAFVGQSLPIEVRAYFDDRFQFELRQPPEIQAEGVIISRLSEPQRRQQLIGGVPHVVLVFQALLTPVKAGTLEIPPARLECQMLLPGGRFPGMNVDPFGGLFAQRRDLKLESNSVELIVRELPRQDQPPHFAGAIGQFSLRQTISPNHGQAGEPMTIKIEISGQGNFAAITAPNFENTRGWRIYTGSENFRATDPIGFSGTKEFEITVMPLNETAEAPQAAFTYFDPVKKEYISLLAPPQPVVVTPNNNAPPPSQQTAQPPPTHPQPQTALPAPSPSPQADSSEDKTTQPTQHAQPFFTYTSRPFEPLFSRPPFLAANAAAAGLLLAWMLFLFAQRASSSPAARRIARQKLLRKNIQRLRSPSLDNYEFFRLAADCLSEIAQIMNIPISDTSSCREMARTLNLSEQQADTLAKAWEVWQELRFSSRPRTPPSRLRDETLNTLRSAAQALSARKKTSRRPL